MADATIVPMRYADIPEILALETESPAAWSREHLEDELEQPTGFQFVLRTKAGEKIAGVIIGRLMDDEAEILKVSVAEKARNRGVGAMLLGFALAYCRKRGAKNCFLELRASNTAARNLYTQEGFKRIGVRRKYYDDPVEDAIIMRRKL